MFNLYSTEATKSQILLYVNNKLTFFLYEFGFNFDLIPNSHLLIC